MFLEASSLYIKGLLLTIVFVFLVGTIRNFWHAIRKLDKTARKRQVLLYDALMTLIMTISVLSFTSMVILLVLRV